MAQHVTNPDDLKLPMFHVNKVIKKVGGESHTFTEEFKTANARASAVFALSTLDVALKNATTDKRFMKAEDIINAVGQLNHEELQGKLTETLNTFRNKKIIKEVKKTKKQASK